MDHSGKDMKLEFNTNRVKLDYSKVYLIHQTPMVIQESVATPSRRGRKPKVVKIKEQID